MAIKKSVVRNLILAGTGVVLAISVTGIWSSLQSSDISSPYEDAGNIPGVEFINNDSSPAIFPLSDLPVVEQERRFDMFLVAIGEKAEDAGNPQLAGDIRTCIQMISCGDVEMYLEYCSQLGILTAPGMTPESSIWGARLERYRRFLLRLRFHHDEIVIREDTGNPREARDLQGFRPDMALRNNKAHPFVERVPQAEQRYVEVLLPYTCLSAATNLDTYGCLGLVMMWNPEVTRWVMVEYRSYQDLGKQPITSPRPVF